MMTIGDVLGVSGLLLALGVCSWAVMMTTALLFPTKSRLSREALEANPIGMCFSGALLMGSVGLVAVLLLQVPNPLIKLFGWIALIGLLSVAAIGSGGLAFLMGSRLREMQDGMSEYQAACRGAALVFLCGLTPILGTFFLAPLALAASIGAGFKAIRVNATEPVQPVSF